MVQRALTNQKDDEMAMPDTIGGMGGANIQLNARAGSGAGAYKRKKKCGCWLDHVAKISNLMRLLKINIC